MLIYRFPFLNPFGRSFFRSPSLVSTRKRNTIRTSTDGVCVDTYPEAYRGIMSAFVGHDFVFIRDMFFLLSNASLSFFSVSLIFNENSISFGFNGPHMSDERFVFGMYEHKMSIYFFPSRFVE